MCIRDRPAIGAKSTTGLEEIASSTDIGPIGSLGLVLKAQGLVVQVVEPDPELSGPPKQ